MPLVDRPAILLLNALLISRLPDRRRTTTCAGRRPRAAGQRRGALRNRGFLALIVLRRRARHQPGPAQRRDPAVAGRRRPTRRRCCWPGCSAPTPCWRCCSRCRPPAASKTVAGALRAARISAGFFVLSCLHRAGHPRHDRLGDDRAGLARPRHRDRRRAVPVRRPLGPDRPSCPTPTGAGSTRAPRGSAAPLGQVWAPAVVHLPRDRAGAPPAGCSSRPSSWSPRSACTRRPGRPSASCSADHPRSDRADRLLESPRGHPRRMARRRASAHPARRRLPRPRRHRRRGVRRRRRCGGRRCSPSSSASPCRSASTTPTTTPTASAAPTTTGSARCGWSARGAATPGAVKRAAFLAFGVAGGRRARARGHHRLVAGRGRRWSACVAAWFYTGGSKPYGYLGLGEVMVFVFFGLVAVIGTTYVQTETWELGRAVRRASASARWPARSSSPTTCATSRPTPWPASARSPSGSATSAPAALYAAAGAGRRGRGRRGRGRHDVVGAARPGLPGRGGARRADRAGRRHRPGAGPGAAADRRSPSCSGRCWSPRRSSSPADRLADARRTLGGMFWILLIVVVAVVRRLASSGCRCWPRCSARTESRIDRQLNRRKR